jgi:hypothetical protein
VGPGGYANGIGGVRVNPLNTTFQPR